MGYFKWVGNGDFADNRNDRTISPGEVVELNEHIVGNHDFVEVDEPPGEGDETPECEESGCSRTVKGGGFCWQHADDE